MQHSDHARGSACSAFSVAQRSSSKTGTSRFRPLRIRRSSGATLASKKSGPTPMAAAASAGVRAMRGIDTASFRVIASKTESAAVSTPFRTTRPRPPLPDHGSQSLLSRHVPPSRRSRAIVNSQPPFQPSTCPTLLPVTTHPPTFRPALSPQPLRLFRLLPDSAADHARSHRGGAWSAADKGLIWLYEAKWLRTQNPQSCPQPPAHFDVDLLPSSWVDGTPNDRRPTRQTAPDRRQSRTHRVRPRRG